MRNIVKARAFNGFQATLLQIFGKGPKMTVVCGDCHRTFKQRVPYLVNNPCLTCPHCGTANQLSGLRWG